MCAASYMCMYGRTLCRRAAIVRKCAEVEEEERKGEKRGGGGGRKVEGEAEEEVAHT